MAFRNRLTAISQLTADVITGAIFQTADPPASRIKIFQDNSGLSLGRILFYAANDPDAAAGYLEYGGTAVQLRGRSDTAGSGSPAGTGSRPAQLTLSGENTNDFPTAARIDAQGEILANDGIKIGFNTAGRKIGALDFGHTSKSVSGGDGHITISHNLLNVPDLVVWSDDAGNHPHTARLQVSSYDINGFTVLARNTTTDALAPNGTTIGGSWIAISLAS